MKEMVVSKSKKSQHAECPAIAQRNLDRSRGPFLLERTHGSPHQAQRRTDLAASESTPAKVLVTSVASLALILLALVMCGPLVPAVTPGASGFPPILGEPLWVPHWLNLLLA